MAGPRVSASLGPPSGKDAIVAFFNQPQLKGTVQALNPQKSSFHLQMKDPSGVTISKEIRFDQIKMLGILRKPGSPEPSKPASARVVTIRFLDGHVIRALSEPYAGSSTGMFVLPLRPETLERVFIPLTAIKEVLAVDKLGDPAEEPSILAPLPTEQPRKSAPSITNEVPPPRKSAPSVTNEVSRMKPLREIMAPAGAAAPAPVPRGESLRPPTTPKKIGEILLEQRFVDKDQIDEALIVQETQRRKRMGEILVEMGFATHKTIAVALAMQWGIPFVDLSTQSPNPRLVGHVPAWFARRWRLMPISEQQGVLTVAVTDPIEHKGVEELRKNTGLTIVMVLATPQDITRAIMAYYPKPAPQPR
jgi:hypothetical protein